MDRLADTPDVVPWTLEDVVAALKRATKASWVREFDDRYLDFERID